VPSAERLVETLPSAERLVETLPSATQVSIPRVDYFPTPSDFGVIDAPMRMGEAALAEASETAGRW
jgi:hypothetical protein